MPALTLLSLLGACSPGAAPPPEDPAPAEVAAPYVFEEPEPCCIVVHLLRTEVWITDDLTPAEFDALDVGFPWMKESVDNYTIQDGGFLRSPGAAADGPTETQTLWEAEFEHIVDVLETPRAVGAGLEAVTIDKHHAITWPALGGENHLQLLVDPDGVEYALVNRDPDRTRDLGSLPEGWSHRHVPLGEDLSLTLRGELTNLNDDNGDLYQGPVTLPEALR